MTHMNKLKTLLLTAALAFNVNAGHDLEDQVAKNMQDIITTCVDHFSGQAYIVNNQLLTCENVTDLVVYFHVDSWERCIRTVRFLANQADKIPGCILVVNDKAEYERAQDLKLEFYNAQIGLGIFRAHFEEHLDGLEI